MIGKILAYAEKNRLFVPGEHILAACSGGADSLCLLEILCRLRETLGIRLSAVHVHHGIRGDAADRDVAFVESYCEVHGIPVILKKVDAPAYAAETHCSLEEAARILRYRAFREAMEACGADKTALAHHLDDQAETILFRMIRGSGLLGLSGMRPVRDCFVRPLLCVSRAEITDWLTREGISWCEDETNAEDAADRNRLRHHTLPALRAVRPDAAEKLADAGAHFAAVDDYLRDRAEGFLDAYLEGNLIPEKPFEALHPVIREYAVLCALERTGLGTRDKGRDHVEEICALFSKQVGSTAALPDGGIARRTYEGVVLYEAGQKENAVLSGDGRWLLETPGIRMETRVFPYEKGIEIPQKEYTKWFDYGKLKDTVALRTRETGDLFSTRPGTKKKLKDYLIDEKIPRELRDSLLLVTAGHEVLWVIGRRMSEAYKITDRTEQVLEITIKPEE